MYLPLLDYQLKLKTEEGKHFVFDPVRKAWMVLTPEEHVRQRLICHFTEALHYPLSLIAVEKTLRTGNRRMRFDLVVYRRDTHEPWLLAECKAPDVAITEGTLQQLLHYQNQLQCRYWVLSNGHQHFCADTGTQGIRSWLDELPAYDL